MRNAVRSSAGVVVTALLIVAIAGCVSSALFAKTEPVREPAVALVNGHSISQDQLTARVEQLYPTTSVHRKAGGSEQLRDMALRQLILEELVWEQSKKAGRVVPYATAAQEMLRVRQLCGPRDFDMGLKQKGLTREAYTRGLQREMTISREQKRRAGRSSISDAEIRSYFDTNRSRFHRPERARIRLILVAVDANATKEVEASAKKKAEKLYAEIQSGRDFADVAAESSDDLYRVTGGDVGWMHKGSFDPEFEPLAFSLPIGKVTEPFRTPPGFSIMRVDAREAAKDMAFEEVRENLRKQLWAQKAKRAQEAWEQSLLKDAKVQILQEQHATDFLKSSAFGTTLAVSH